MAIWYKRQCLTVGFFLVSLHISAISILISSCVCVFSYSYSVCYFFCFDALRMACNASGNVLYVTLSSAPKSTPIPCTHTSVFHRSFLLCSSLFSMRTFQSLARSFTWFLFCVLLYIYFFSFFHFGPFFYWCKCYFYFCWYFWYCCRRSYFSTRLDSLAISHFINFRPVYILHAQCSYCGAVRIQFVFSFPFFPTLCRSSFDISLRRSGFFLLLFISRRFLLLFFFYFFVCRFFVCRRWCFSFHCAKYVWMSVQVRIRNRKKEWRRKKKKERQIERIKVMAKRLPQSCAFFRAWSIFLRFFCLRKRVRYFLLLCFSFCSVYFHLCFFFMRCLLNKTRSSDSKIQRENFEFSQKTA